MPLVLTPGEIEAILSVAENATAGKPMPEIFETGIAKLRTAYHKRRHELAAVEHGLDAGFAAKLHYLGNEIERLFNLENVPLKERSVGYFLLAFPVREDGRVNFNNSVTNLSREALVELVDMLKETMAATDWKRRAEP